MSLNESGRGGSRLSYTIGLIVSISVAAFGVVLGLLVFLGPVFRGPSVPSPTASPTASSSATASGTASPSNKQSSPSSSPIPHFTLSPQPVVVVPSVITIKVDSGGGGLSAVDTFLGALAPVITAAGSVAAFVIQRNRHAQPSAKPSETAASGE